MVHKDIIERRKDKLKPRGKPFQKGNKRGKIEDETSVNRGCEVSVERGFVTPTHQPEPIEEKETPMDTIDKILNENMTAPAEIVTIGSPINIQEVKDLELIDSLDFSNGLNKVSIRFSKRHNRMYRIQIFINDVHEVRPVTYSGASTGMTFWKLLKGVLKS